MTENIHIAIIERNVLAYELRTIKEELEVDDTEFPLSDMCRKALLIRMGVLDAGIKYIERMIINDLNCIPLTEYLTPKAKENE